MVGRNFVLFILMGFTFAYAQQEHKAISDNGLLKLNITFPAHNDTFALERVRIAGGTDPLARVFVNDKMVRVYPQGAFVTRVPLQEGMNQIIIQAEKNGNVARDILYIYRPPELRTSPAVPTQIDPALIEPAGDVWMMPGDYLHVRFKGSPGGIATFSIKKQYKNIGMVEEDSVSTKDVGGIYSGVYRLSPALPNRPYEIQFVLRGQDGKKVKAKAPGKLYIMPDEVPIVGQTIDEAEIWDAPTGGARLGIIDSTVRVTVVGKFMSRYKIKLSANRHAYINDDMLRILPVGTPIPSTFVSTPAISFDRDWYKLTMQINTRVPYLVEQHIDPPTLDLYLFSAYQGTQWTTFPNDSIEISRIQWSQVDEDILRIRFSLKQKQQWGYKLEYNDNQLVLYIRRKPRIAPPPDSPVKGLKFVLDPGHGGEEALGAVSPTGIYEKEVNLKWALNLADLLRAAGATVVLTRTEDVDVSLRERVRIARQSNANIFISLHNNSVGAASNAAVVRGTSVYYHEPQSQDLAWAIYPHLVQMGLSPMGRSFTSFYVNRNTAMPAVLVEGVFMSSPLDEQLLMDDHFWQRMAHAVFEGLEDFLARQR